MRSFWIRGLPKSNDYPFIKEERTHRHGKVAMWRRAGMAMTLPDTKECQQPAETEEAKKAPPGVFRGSAACWHLDLWHLASRTMRVHISIILSLPVYFSSPSRVIRSLLEFPSTFPDFSWGQRPYLLQFFLQPHRASYNASVAKRIIQQYQLHSCGGVKKDTGVNLTWYPERTEDSHTAVGNSAEMVRPYPSFSWWHFAALREEIKTGMLTWIQSRGLPGTPSAFYTRQRVCVCVCV